MASFKLLVLQIGTILIVARQLAQTQKRTPSLAFFPLSTHTTWIEAHRPEAKEEAWRYSILND